MMATTLDEEMEQGAEALTRLWWVVLLAGIAWFLISLVILRFDTTSVTTVGILLGVVFLAAACNEVLELVVVPSWRFLRILLAVLFTVAAIWCFASPDDAFWSLASILGLLFVLKGTFDIFAAAESRAFNSLWGLGLAAGILEVLLGFWASQQFYPARAVLILIWVGFFALFRGIGEIVLAFRIRSEHKHLAAA
jgi:uncharacterized membrane protein HdeD (DUF308 family)